MTTISITFTPAAISQLLVYSVQAFGCKHRHEIQTIPVFPTLANPIVSVTLPKGTKKINVIGFLQFQVMPPVSFTSNTDCLDNNTVFTLDASGSTATSVTLTLSPVVSTSPINIIVRCGGNKCNDCEDRDIVDLDLRDSACRCRNKNLPKCKCDCKPKCKCVEKKVKCAEKIKCPEKKKCEEKKR